MATASPSTQGPPATVSPSDVYGSMDSFSEDYSEVDDNKSMAYLLLEFPDVSWAMREPSVVLGRDEKLQRYLDDTQYLRQPKSGDGHVQPASNQPGFRSDASESSPDESDVEDDFPGGTEFKYSPDGGCRTHLPLEYADGKKTRRSEQFLAVHPPVDEDTGELPALTKISKEHVRLDVQDDGVLMTVLGRNGLFLNDGYYKQDDTERVEDGDRIRIANLDIYLRFNPTTLVDDYDDDSDMDSSQGEAEEVNEVNHTPESSVERNSALGAKDRKRAKEQIRQLAEGLAVAKPRLSRTIKLSELQKRDPGETKDELKARLEDLTGGQIQPRKGPGRPPANGLMSKRQMRELAKSAKQSGVDEASGRGATGGKAGSDPTKTGNYNDLGRDVNGSAKDKSKKRKRSDTGADAKDGKGIDRKRKEESPRSPSPTEDQYTSEQLEHPGLTYVVMIHKILKDCEPKQLNLQQMYKEVKRRWPYYRFRKESSGWESSVRHTIKSSYFQQGERDGKGFKYTINPAHEPPAQKQKPAPAPPQLVPYTNGQYPRGPPYGPPYNGANYRPNYPAQGAYPPYPMHGQRPPGNATAQSMQQPATYNQHQHPQLQNMHRQPQQMQNGQAGHAAGHAGAAFTSHPDGSMNASGIVQPSSNQANTTAPQLRLPQQQPTQSMPNQANGQSQPQHSTTTSGGLASTNNVHAQPPRPAQASQQVPAQFQNSQRARPLPTPIPTTNGTISSHLQQPRISSPAIISTASNHLSLAQNSASNSADKTPTTVQARPPSRPASTNISRPPTPASNSLLPSEEVRQGRTPQVILNWKQKLLEPSSNLPQHVMDEQIFRVDAAIGWFMKNPEADVFKATPEVQGSWKNLVPLIQNMIREHDKTGSQRRSHQVRKASS